MIYSKLSAWPPGDISRRSFHPRRESRRASRALSLPTTRVFDIIEIPKAPGALQFRSIFLPLPPTPSASSSPLSWLTLFPLRSLIRAAVCPPCLQSALSRPTLSRPSISRSLRTSRDEAGNGERGLGGAGMPPEPDNLTEARWDKIASRWLGWCSCGSPYNSAATPSEPPFRRVNTSPRRPHETYKKTLGS